jgi:mono/diheme cytochrome c family protein
MKTGHRRTMSLLLLVALLAAGCGGADESAKQSPEPTVASTRAIAIPTFSFTQPTVVPAVATAAATLASSSGSETLDPEVVERGHSRYVDLGCAECHGESAGGTDQGGPLLEYSGTKTEFVTLMRSGGTMGISHQYASNRLSETGASNIYQYLQSLKQ